jgi:glycerophosphoryl diester phosphodiesterase
LSDVLDFACGRIRVNIELKIPGIEEKVASMIFDKNLVQETLVSSFVHLSLSEIREINEDIQTAILVQTEIKDLASYASELGVQAVNPSKDLVTEYMISSVHDQQIKVYPWTVNEERNMIQLLELGVDGLITDYPERSILIVRSRLS